MHLNQKGIIHLIPLLLLLAGIVAGVYLVQHPQIFKPKASSKLIEVHESAGSDPAGNPCKVYEKDGQKKTNCPEVKLKITSPEDAGLTSDAGFQLIKEVYAQTADEQTSFTGKNYQCSTDGTKIIEYVVKTPVSTTPLQNIPKFFGIPIEFKIPFLNWGITETTKTDCSAQGLVCSQTGNTIGCVAPGSTVSIPTTRPLPIPTSAPTQAPQPLPIPTSSPTSARQILEQRQQGGVVTPTIPPGTAQPPPAQGLAPAPQQSRGGIGQTVATAIRRLFNVEQPVNLTPVNDAVILADTSAIIFSWSGPSQATRYRFMIDSEFDKQSWTDNNCAPGLPKYKGCFEKYTYAGTGGFIEKDIQASTELFKKGDKYTWWVDALDENGNRIGIPSRGTSFTVGAVIEGASASCKFVQVRLVVSKDGQDKELGKIDSSVPVDIKSGEVDYAAIYAYGEPFDEYGSMRLSKSRFNWTINGSSSEGNSLGELSSAAAQWKIPDSAGKYTIGYEIDGEKQPNCQVTFNIIPATSGTGPATDDQAPAVAPPQAPAGGTAPSPSPSPSIIPSASPQVSPAGAPAPAAVVCQDNPSGATLPSSSYKWVADCNSNCQTNNDCPTNSSDEFVCPSSSNWCYDFTGAVGHRCLKLEYIGPRTEPIPGAPGGPACPDRPQAPPPKRVTKHFRITEDAADFFNKPEEGWRDYSASMAPLTYPFKNPNPGLKVIFVQFRDDKGEIIKVKGAFFDSVSIELEAPSAPVAPPPAGGDTSTACSQFETYNVCGEGLLTYDKCTDDKGQTGSQLCSGQATKFYCEGSGNSNCISDPTKQGNYACSGCPNLAGRATPTSPLGIANCNVRPARVNIGGSVTYQVLVQGGKPPYYFNLTGDFSKSVTSQTDTAEITQTFDSAGLKRVNLIVGSGAEQSNTFCPAVQVSSSDGRTEPAPQTSSNISPGSACSAYETTSVCGGGFKTYDKCTDDLSQTGSRLCSGGATDFYCEGSTNSNCISSTTRTPHYSCSGCPNLSNR